MGKTTSTYASQQEISGNLQTRRRQGRRAGESGNVRRIKRPNETTNAEGLLPHDALPPFLRDNEYLHKYHRPQLNSFLKCFKSIFSIHTETGNIWTHLVGTVVFSLYTVYFLISDADIPMKLTFSVYLISLIFGMAASTLFHTLSCHSPDVCNFFCKMDYCGVILMIVASFTPWLYYGFYCKLSSAMFYQFLVLGFGIACSVVALQNKFGQPNYRPLRAGLFMGLGLSGVIPALHYITTEGILHILGPFCWLLLMAGMYITGGTIYALRIPERLWPGKFDVVSHQIMHICVVAGAFAGFQGICSIAEYRQQNLECDAL